MKIFFSYQGIKDKYFLDFSVSSSITVAEFLNIEEIKKITNSIDHDLVFGVNGELLDGNFKPLPHKYRLKEGERVEIYRPLQQNPKERRLNKV
jgi:putative ubiquitin-RnfH superfamily antitoxin RatB of RatAB toxin-antitoxin module|tara:strand:- start:2146 stop:2424 length:279 start_codon:yes stop_codon:yes gene_type:complete